MKNILLLLILFIGIQNLGLSQTREEIIQRYSNGEKSLVVTYVGQGNNEKIIKLIASSAHNNRLSTKLFHINTIDKLLKN